MNHLREYLEIALRDAGVLELRQLADGRVRSGIYDQLNALEDAVVAISDVSTAFVSLNAPKLHRASNTMTDSALSDADIVSIVRLPFDFDSVRPKGVNASAAEVEKATSRRDRFAATMRAYAWPMPLLGMSGNGAHALYRCRFPARDDLREKLTVIYTGLRVDYSDDAVLFDPSVRNPSRIWRAYGTKNRKHPATVDRPHRMATYAMPARWECVSPRALDVVAETYAKRNLRAERAPSTAPRRIAAGSGDYRTLDVVALFRAHNAYKRGLSGGKHAVACPWSHEHTIDHGPLGTDTVAFENDADRWPGFHCSHAHCDGRGIADIIELWSDTDTYCARQFGRVAS